MDNRTLDSSSSSARWLGRLCCLGAGPGELIADEQLRVEARAALAEHFMLRDNNVTSSENAKGEHFSRWTEPLAMVLSCFKLPRRMWIRESSNLNLNRNCSAMLVLMELGTQAFLLDLNCI